MNASNSNSTDQNTSSQQSEAEVLRREIERLQEMVRSQAAALEDLGNARSQTERELEIERDEREAMGIVIRTIDRVDSILKDIDRITCIKDLFDYLLESVPKLFGMGTKFHFVWMDGYLSDDSDSSRNPQINDLWEIFRSSLAAYLERAEHEKSKEISRWLSIHKFSAPEATKGRMQFPIVIKNALVGCGAEKVDELVGFIEVSKRSEAINALVRPEEQIEKVMRSIQSHFERIQSALLIEEHKKLAWEDALTWLPNRRGFFQYVKSVRDHSPAEGFAAIAIDIDHFKRINDEYGHSVGDLALRHVGEIFREKTSSIPNCVLGRVWGEEFVAYLHDWNMEDALALSENIRESLASTSFHQEGIKLTASFWVAASYSADEKVEAVIKRADRASYEVKNNGRNAVRAYDEETMKTPVSEMNVNWPVRNRRMSSWRERFQTLMNLHRSR